MVLFLTRKTKGTWHNSTGGICHKARALSPKDEQWPESRGHRQGNPWSHDGRTHSGTEQGSRETATEVNAKGQSVRQTDTAVLKRSMQETNLFVCLLIYPYSVSSSWIHIK